MGLAAVEDRGRSVASPNGEVIFRLLERDPTGLRYQISLDNVVIEPSRLGIAIDGLDLDEGASRKSRTIRDQRAIPCLGVHSTATNRCRGAKFFLLHPDTRTSFVLDVRAFDDGVAFRHIVPGKGIERPMRPRSSRSQGEHSLDHSLGGHYEGVHENKPIESIEAGDWIAPPLTFKLPHAPAMPRSQKSI